MRGSNHTSPDGGIGRRAGLKHQWRNPCRFDPGSGYPTKCKCLIFKHLHFSFCFLHHACTTEWAVLGQNLCFSEKFSVWPVSFGCLKAKVSKVWVNRKKPHSLDRSNLNFIIYSISGKFRSIHSTHFTTVCALLLYNSSVSTVCFFIKSIISSLSSLIPNNLCIKNT